MVFQEFRDYTFARYATGAVFMDPFVVLLKITFLCKNFFAAKMRAFKLLYNVSNKYLNIFFNSYHAFP